MFPAFRCITEIMQEQSISDPEGIKRGILNCIFGFWAVLKPHVDIFFDKELLICVVSFSLFGQQQKKQSTFCFWVSYQQTTDSLLNPSSAWNTLSIIYSTQIKSESNPVTGFKNKYSNFTESADSLYIKRPIHHQLKVPFIRFKKETQILITSEQNSQHPAKPSVLFSHAFNEIGELPDWLWD